MSNPQRQVNAPNHEFLDQLCEHCHYGHYSFTNDNNDWWVKCTECATLKFCYVPQPHQYDFHADQAKFRLYAGGFGSAKTSTCAAEFIHAAISTPNGLGLIGAQTVPQLENTAKLEFKNMLTRDLIDSEHVQRNEFVLINGYRVLFRPLDDEGKIRSLNLSHFWIEEASEVSLTIFNQLKTRLRNNATKYHFGILSTNPEMNWVKTEFLLSSSRITGGEFKYDKLMNDEINPYYSTHIAETKKNKYLPPDYFETNTKGKPEWWINRYMKGSFENREGLVYPQFEDNIVDSFDIPAHWEKMQASDFGIHDPTVALWGAIDPKTGTVYIYDEHYENNKPVNYHAKKMKDRLDHIPFGRLRFVVGDPNGANRSHGDMRSTFDHYAEYGVYFQPGNNRIVDGIMKVFTFFDIGKIKIFKTCRNLIKELQNLRYPEQKENSKKNVGDKPIDKDDHAADCLRYMIVELPDDPNDLITEHYNYYLDNAMILSKNDGDLPHSMQDDNETSQPDWYNYY